MEKLPRRSTRKKVKKTEKSPLGTFRKSKLRKKKEKEPKNNIQIRKKSPDNILSLTEGGIPAEFKDPNDEQGLRIREYSIMSKNLDIMVEQHKGQIFQNYLINGVKIVKYNFSGLCLDFHIIQFFEDSNPWNNVVENILEYIKGPENKTKMFRLIVEFLYPDAPLSSIPIDPFRLHSIKFTPLDRELYLAYTIIIHPNNIPDSLLFVPHFNNGNNHYQFAIDNSDHLMVAEEERDGYQRMKHIIWKIFTETIRDIKIQIDGENKGMIYRPSIWFNLNSGKRGKTCLETILDFEVVGISYDEIPLTLTEYFVKCIRSVLEEKNVLDPPRYYYDEMICYNYPMLNGVPRTICSIKIEICSIINEACKDIQPTQIIYWGNKSDRFRPISYSTCHYHTYKLPQGNRIDDLFVSQDLVSNTPNQSTTEDYRSV